MVELAATTAEKGIGTDTLQTQLTQVASASYISEGQIRDALVSGWERAVDRVLTQGVISAPVESSLNAFAKMFGFSDGELDASGARTRLVKGIILREVLSGTVPDRVTVQGPLPFNLVKSEILVWMFSTCTYYEDRVHRTHVGGYQGVSLRVFKGVYYHVGGFRGQSVETHSLESLGLGALGVTNKHIFFVGTQKSLRIPYPKIVSFDPYSDGIGVHRDAASARPQIFVTGDGWFTYNLVTNLAKLA
jgi:hypothetical protein